MKSQNAIAVLCVLMKLMNGRIISNMKKLLIVLLISFKLTELTTFITVIGVILSGRVILSSPTMRDVGFNKIVTIL